MARVSMTYGVMPTREQFDAACDESDLECGPNGSVAATGFQFGNDRRVGDATLSPDELWTELQRAHAESGIRRRGGGDLVLPRARMPRLAWI